MNSKRLAGRIALITGASRGIGRAVALAFAGEGAHVILLGRTLGALEELDDEIREAGGSATLLQLDLRKGDKLDALGPTLFQRWGKLDILVGNAGILGPLSPLGHITADAWADVMAINLTANWRLIRTCDPLLRKSDAGRAIFVSSGAASGSFAYWGPYAVSKAGLEALVKTYAQEVERTPVRANLINPGPIRTGMRAKAFPGEDPQTLSTPDELAPLFVELASPDCTRNGEVIDFKDWQAAHKPTGK
jgi:NAD(P)-dependent dehydrogenase (short-subunit alcohol dehydrogenase family)